MRTKVAIVALLVVCTGLLTTPAIAGGRASSWFRGVKVMPGGVVRGNEIVYDHGAVVVIPAVIEGFDSCLSGYVTRTPSPR